MPSCQVHNLIIETTGCRRIAIECFAFTHNFCYDLGRLPEIRRVFSDFPFLVTTLSTATTFIYPQNACTNSCTMKPSVFSAVLVSLVTTATTIRAHGFIETWTIDGTSYNGYDPTDNTVPMNSDTATRPSDNDDTGEFFCKMSPTCSIGMNGD